MYDKNENLEAFIHAFNNGEYDDEFDNALGSDRSHVIPSAHNAGIL